MPEQIIPVNDPTTSDSPVKSQDDAPPISDDTSTLPMQPLAEDLPDLDYSVPQTSGSPRNLTIDAHGEENGDAANPMVDCVTPNTRRASLLKQRSSFVSPTGQHLDKPKQGRRLSFSDEHAGEALVETNFSDKLHYSTGHTNYAAQQQQGPSYSKPSKNGCCTIS